MAQQRAGAREESHDGYEKELADYDRELARYLQARFSRASVAVRSLCWRGPSQGRSPAGAARADRGQRRPGAGEGPDAGFEAVMHELQAELGDDWIPRFSVQGGTVG
jgi:hypothetical protein